MIFGGLRSALAARVRAAGRNFHERTLRASYSLVQSHLAASGTTIIELRGETQDGVDAIPLVLPVHRDEQDDPDAFFRLAARLEALWRPMPQTDEESAKLHHEVRLDAISILSDSLVEQGVDRDAVERVFAPYRFSPSYVPPPLAVVMPAPALSASDREKDVKPRADVPVEGEKLSPEELDALGQVLLSRPARAADDSVERAVGTSPVPGEPEAS